MPLAQLIGSVIENCIWVLAGFYIVFGWPRRVRQQVASGKLTEEAAQARLTKFRPQFGYLLVALGVVRIVSDIYQAQ